VDLSNFGPNTVFTRGTQLKVQDVDTLQWQSDFTNKFEALGYKHELVTGVDFSREEKEGVRRGGRQPDQAHHHGRHARRWRLPR
jgi:outer membrane receptor for monomeric catechols